MDDKLGAKKEFRRNASKVRNAIPKELRDIKDDLVFRKIIMNRYFKSAEKVFVYVSYKSEVDTIRLIKSMLEKGEKSVCVPVVHGSEMIFIQIHDFNEMKESDMGILEPVYDKEKEVIIDENSVMLLPGLAFTEGGLRMGYGGGFYDKYMHKYSDVKFMKFGLCYYEQIYDIIPVDENDVRLDALISD
ncbi:MAG: 5-formyltetrahydrofolate cyclo-ligase [Lachnospiraceae bacterium]|nr:5-formyltetrahydrofolate cyclo-ligase [Lachnospiraceae bacterium]